MGIYLTSWYSSEHVMASLIISNKAAKRLDEDQANPSSLAVFQKPPIIRAVFRVQPRYLAATNRHLGLL